MTKKELIRIMFTMFDTMNEDMTDVFAPMWDALMEHHNFRFVSKIANTELDEYCTGQFDGEVRDCFYEYINGKAINTLERFENRANHFIEETPAKKLPEILSFNFKPNAA